MNPTARTRAIQSRTTVSSFLIPMTREYNRRFIDTGGFGVTGIVEFSKDAGCWTYLCQWGCQEIDFEGAAEATTALTKHNCSKGA